MTVIFGWIFTSFCVILVAKYLWQFSRFSHKSVPYTVVRKDGSFEIRDYPTLTIIETPISKSANDSFMLLFNFIKGKNQQKQMIEMIIPVMMTG